MTVNQRQLKPQHQRPTIQRSQRPATQNKLPFYIQENIKHTVVVLSEQFYYWYLMFRDFNIVGVLHLDYNWISMNVNWFGTDTPHSLFVYHLRFKYEANHRQCQYNVKYSHNFPIVVVVEQPHTVRWNNYIKWKKNYAFLRRVSNQKKKKFSSPFPFSDLLLLLLLLLFCKTMKFIFWIYFFLNSAHKNKKIWIFNKWPYVNLYVYTI